MALPPRRLGRLERASCVVAGPFGLGVERPQLCLAVAVLLGDRAGLAEELGTGLGAAEPPRVGAGSDLGEALVQLPLDRVQLGGEIGAFGELVLVAGAFGREAPELALEGKEPTRGTRRGARSRRGARRHRGGGPRSASTS